MGRSANPPDLVAQMQRMQEQIRQLRMKRDPVATGGSTITWTSLTPYLTADWSQDPSAFIGYGGDGIIRLRGSIYANVATSNSIVPTATPVPTAYRPSAANRFVSFVLGGGNYPTGRGWSGDLIFSTTGTIALTAGGLISGTTQQSGFTQFQIVNLDGISFSI